MGSGAECFFPLLVVAIVVVFLAINAHSRTSAFNEAFERLATHFGGRSRGGGWYRNPSATFATHGMLVRVDVFAPGGRQGQRYTQVHLDWPDPKFRFEVFPAPQWGRMGQLVGMQEVEIGSPAFDDQYVVRGSDVREVRALLSGAVQHQINVLQRFLDNDDIYISIGRGQLLVKKLSLIRDADQLIRLVQLALELRAQAQLTQMAGIEFDDDSKAQPIEAATCLVCGEVMGLEMVICRRCKTPHHRDCWHYFGRCATYGCGETRFYMPKTAPALRPGRGPG